MDLFLLLGIPLVAGLVVAVICFRYALDDDLGLAFALPAIGLFTILPMQLLGLPQPVPGMNASMLPGILLMLGWAVLVFGAGGALLGWLVAALRG